MQQVKDIFKYLSSVAPLELQMNFDNAGFLVGHRDAPVRTALLSLDITEEVIDEAAERQAELIIAHHPVIFHAIKALTDLSVDRRVLSLAEKRIAAICMHTNLDIAQGGVNDVLIELLGASCDGALDQAGCGRFGSLPQEMPLEAFLSRCKTRLNVGCLRYVPGGKPVRRLAVMGGAGADSLWDAYEKGCDTYVTSDVKYHQFQEAQQMGVTLIDADHFCTEYPVIPRLAESLREQFPDVRFLLSRYNQTPVCFY